MTSQDYGARLKPAKKRRKGKTPMKTADELFSKIIRSRGRCANEKCKQPFDFLQCAHGFSRRYHATRWDERNAFCLCRGCHHWFTHRPLEWDEWLQGQWGQDLYYEIRALALWGHNPKIPEVVAVLRIRAVEIGAA